MEVEDEGHASMQRLVCASEMRQDQAGQDRCTDLGSLAYEDSNDNKVFHRHGSIYNNFKEEVEVDVLWKKIDIMFEKKNVVKRVSIFRKIMRL